METEYDIIIIGSGPAGMSAGIYARRAGMKVLILEGLVPGGQIANTPLVENFPGFEKIDGAELGTLMFNQTKNLGADILFCKATSVNLSSSPKQVQTSKGTFFGTAVILAMGASPRSLGVENENKFVGKGLSYCAVCDGALYRNKTVAIFGGGNSAIEDALYLGSLAKKVFHIHRRSEFRADSANLKAYNEMVNAKGNLTQYLGFVAEKIYGEKFVESVDIRNVLTNEIINLKTDGIFVAVGRVPQTEIVQGQLNLDENGCVVVDQNMQTNIEGVFGAGDVVKKSLRQITTAVGDGSIAGTNASSYVKKLKAGK